MSEMEVALHIYQLFGSVCEMRFVASRVLVVILSVCLVYTNPSPILSTFKFYSEQLYIVPHTNEIKGTCSTKSLSSQNPCVSRPHTKDLKKKKETENQPPTRTNFY